MKLKYDLVLASKSPRRKRLLEERGFEFEIIALDIDEELCIDLSVEENVQNLSYNKVSVILNKYKFENSIILGADTVVYLEGKILGKPKDINQAKEYLRLLSNNIHEVYSGIALYNPEKNLIITDYEKTKVKFGMLDESVIDFYIREFNPLDKAGAYGIQDFGAFFVQKVDGCFFNVVGLPLYKLFSILKSERLFLF